MERKSDKKRIIYKAQGAGKELFLLETPEHGLLVKRGRVVNEEGYKQWQEQQEQAKMAPKAPQKVNMPKPQENPVDGRIEALESKMDNITSLLEKLVNEKS